MNRTWRNGSIELVDGYILTDAEGQRVTALEEARFAIEGGYVNVEVPGVPRTQIVSAPTIRLLTCDSVDVS
jgi:hypothetical protein